MSIPSEVIFRVLSFVDDDTLHRMEASNPNPHWRDCIEAEARDRLIVPRGILEAAASKRYVFPIRPFQKLNALSLETKKVEYRRFHDVIQEYRRGNPLDKSTQNNTVYDYIHASPYNERVTSTWEAKWIWNVFQLLWACGQNAWLRAP